MTSTSTLVCACLVLAHCASGFLPSPAALGGRLKVRMAWGSDDVYVSVSVAANLPGSALGTRKLVLDVPSQVAMQHTIPGMFVKLRKDEQSKPGFFAIASVPPSSSNEAADGSNEFEFLIKETEGSAWLTGMEEGAVISMSSPMGKGFQTRLHFDEAIEEYDFTIVDQIYLLATGTGVAPLRALINSKVLRLGSELNPFTPRKATLLIGAKTSKHLPFLEEYHTWEQEGISVIPVLSSESDPTWLGQKGYVQHVLNTFPDPSNPKQTGALVVGQREMFDASKAWMLERGVFPGRVRSNF